MRAGLHDPSKTRPQKNKQAKRQPTPPALQDLLGRLLAAVDGDLLDGLEQLVGGTS